jgi:CRP-like cAMP-binding protein
MDPRELLGMIAFFSEALNGDEIFALAAGAKRRTYPAGAVLIREDDPASSLFVIESGEVSVSVAGEAKPLATLFAGDFVGEMSLLTGEPANATVTATDEVVAHEIGPAVLAPVLAESPALDERLAETMEKRQDELDHLYGNPAWGMTRRGKGELLGLIRKFYEASAGGQ